MLAPRPVTLPRLRRDRARERAVQSRLMLVAERALQARLAQVIAAAGRRAAEAQRHGEDIDAALRALPTDLVRVLVPSLVDTARTFGGRVIRSPKSAHAFPLERKAYADLDEALDRYLTARTARQVVAISRTLRDAIRDVIRDGLIEDVGIDELARRIVAATSGEIGMARARRIARTEMHNASMYGQQAAAEASPLAFEKVWLATEDARTRKSHADANDQRVPLDEPFVLQGERGTVRLMFPGDPNGPPHETINCFPPETLVSGRVLAATRHWYDGDLVEIVTCDGRKLAGTPNHPVLTARGWVALGQINESDDLVCSSGGRNRHAPGGVRQNVDDHQTTIEQVFNSLATSAGAVRVPAVAVNFHGDVPAHDVDIVRADGVLEHDWNTAAFEHACELALCGSDLASSEALGERLPMQLDLGCGDGSAQMVGRRHQRDALSGCCSSHSGAHSLAAGSRATTIAPKAAVDGAAELPESVGDRLDRVPGVEQADGLALVSLPSLSVHKGESLIDGAGRAGPANPAIDRSSRPTDHPGDDRDAETGLVELDRVVAISRRRYAGHVYNLECVDGAYLARSVFVHNCRCTVAYEPLPYYKPAPEDAGEPAQSFEPDRPLPMELPDDLSDLARDGRTIGATEEYSPEERPYVDRIAQLDARIEAIRDGADDDWRRLREGLDLVLAVVESNPDVVTVANLQAMLRNAYRGADRPPAAVWDRLMGVWLSGRRLLAEIRRLRDGGLADAMVAIVAAEREQVQRDLAGARTSGPASALGFLPGPRDVVPMPIAIDMVEPDEIEAPQPETEPEPLADRRLADWARETIREALDDLDRREMGSADDVARTLADRIFTELRLSPPGTSTAAALDAILDRLRATAWSRHRLRDYLEQLLDSDLTEEAL